MPSLPAWIRSLKSTCSVHCHTAIQHHSITYNINDQSVIGSEIIATVPTCGSSLRSSHGTVWVECLGREIIWLDTSFNCSVVLVQCSEFYFGFSFLLGKDYNFNLVLVLITKSQKGY